MNLSFEQAPNGLRYLRVGGRGFCLGAGKTRSQKMLLNRADSHTSGARFVSLLFLNRPHVNNPNLLDYLFRFLVEIKRTHC